MKYVVEDEGIGPCIATTDGNGVECSLEYLKLKSNQDGYELSTHGETRCKLSYADMWYLRAALTILESEYQHLSPTDIYKLGEKV